jgi:uncharacterized glyoxalase superfamily protein PhnB
MLNLAPNVRRHTSRQNTMFVANTPYGDRRTMVKEPWGNTWQIATRIRGAGS